MSRLVFLSPARIISCTCPSATALPDTYCTYCTSCIFDTFTFLAMFAEIRLDISEDCSFFKANNASSKYTGMHLHCNSQLQLFGTKHVGSIASS